MKKVKIGTVQLSCSDQTTENLEKHIQAIRKAASQGANIICLQELFKSLYFCDTEDHQKFSLAEEIQRFKQFLQTNDISTLTCRFSNGLNMFL